MTATGTGRKPASKRHPLDVDAPGRADAGASNRVPLSTRIRPETLKRAKLFAVNTDTPLQDVVEAALIEYIARRP